MAFSYPLSLPTTPGFTSFTWNWATRVGVSESIFTGQQEVQEWTGQILSGELALPPMSRAQADEWETFLMELKGQYGTFYLGDPHRETARGSVTGTPLVAGGSQTGNHLIIDGLTPGTTFLEKGDWIQVGSTTTQRIYRLLSQATADSAGEATLDIFPRLRESPADNASVVTSSCKGVFRLASPVSSSQAREIPVYGMKFSFAEAI